MNEYFPDKWSLIEFGSGYAIIAGWRGGFATGDSWRRSTLIASVEALECGWKATMESGSVYLLPEQTYGVTFLTQSIIASASLDVVEDIEQARVILNSLKGEKNG